MTGDPSFSYSSIEAAAPTVQLEQVIEAVTSRLHAGEPVDIEALAGAHPELADELRDLLPALQMLSWVADAGLGTAGSADAERHPALPADRLGDFRLIRLIGRGGMGMVFEAEQLSLRRTVALKILPFAAVLDERALARFQSEAYAAATLQHPNIVPVFAVGSDRGVHFYAMPRINGRGLDALLDEMRQRQNAPLTMTDKAPSGVVGIASSASLDSSGSASYFRKVAELGIQAADALHAAHLQHIVHRDVKPANLLFDAGGKLWITDFGLARISGDANMTMPGDLLGTARYMSPEQVLGRPAEVDYRTDIYSLGATLYELLSLRPAFDGSDRAELTRRIAVEDPPRLDHIDRRIPVDLATIVGKAMQKVQRDRYASAAELADDLRRFLSHRPIRARQATCLERAIKWSRRHHAAVTAAGLVLLVLSGVLFVSTVLINRARVAALAALDEKSELLYTATMRAAFDAWEHGWTDEVRALLDQGAAQENLSRPRRLEWRLLDRLTAQPPPVVLAGHAGAVNEVAVFADRRRLASVGNDGTLRIWDLATHSSWTVPIADEPLHSLAISPDGRYVAVGGHTVFLCDLRESATGRPIFRSAHNVESLAFSPDGALLAVGVRYHEVCLLSLDGTILQRVPCDSRVESLEFMPESNLLLVPNRRTTPAAALRGVLQLWRDDLSAVEQELDGTKEGNLSLFSIAKASPCGGLIAAGELYRSRVCILDAATGGSLAKTPIGRDALSALAYSPKGDGIAAGHTNGVVEFFRIKRAEGEPLTIPGPTTAIGAHQGAVKSVAFVEADSLATAGADGFIRIWDLSPTGQSFDLDVPLVASALSPDGTRIACLGTSHLALLDWRGRAVNRTRQQGNGITWSPASDRLALCREEANEIVVLDGRGREIFRIAHDGTPRQVAFSPDGEYFAVIGSNVLQLCQTQDGREVQRRSLSGEGGSAVAFSPDGQLLAYGGRFGALVIANEQGQVIYERPCHSEIKAVGFTPDGSLLATGHQDCLIRLWNPQTGAQQAQLAGHGRAIRSVLFAPDGRSLLSAARDGTIRLWAVHHGQSLGVVHRAHQEKQRPLLDDVCTDVSLSANGQRIAIAYTNSSNSSVVLQWDLGPALADGLDIHSNPRWGD